MNKDNWSGEEFELVVKNNTFELNGYVFTMNAEQLEEGDVKYTVTSPDWKEPVAVGFCFRSLGDNYSTFTCDFSDVNRSHSNPYVAAAQLLFNTI